MFSTGGANQVLSQVRNLGSVAPAYVASGYIDILLYVLLHYGISALFTVFLVLHFVDNWLSC